MTILPFVLGGASAVYYMVLVLYAGVFASFSLFWLLAAFVFCGMGMLRVLKGRLSVVLKKFLFLRVFSVTTMILFLCIFLITEFLVAAHMDDYPEEECDYLIVLGCQVRKDHMTKSLKYRLDAAYEYAENNTGCTIIVSGGMGENEDVTEAVAMREYLIEKGIDSSRILMERFASNTRQNLKLSYALVSDRDNAKIGIVTSSFHLFRSLRLAESIGMKNIQGLAAKSDPLLVVNNMVREFFALMKEKLVGNI